MSRLLLHPNSSALKEEPVGFVTPYNFLAHFTPAPRFNQDFLFVKRVWRAGGSSHYTYSTRDHLIGQRRAGRGPATRTPMKPKFKPKQRSRAGTSNISLARLHSPPLASKRAIMSGCSGDEHVKAAKNDDFDDDDSFGDGDSATADESGVQLGTVVPLEGPPESVLFRNVDWHDWDGGKAGGWPVWLNPRDLPAPQDMCCGECTHPLSFLVQLYCPMDHEDDAFHRCLYVFCCPKASCSKNSSVKALRCQLPRENDFYPYEPDDKVEMSALKDTERASILAKRLVGADPAAWNVNVCCVCGQLAKSACSKCRKARYCGRAHQTQHWKHGGHKKACSDDDASNNNENGQEFPPPPGDARVVAPKNAVGALPANAMSSVFREFEVEVRPEPPPPPAAPEERTAEDTLASQMDFGGEGDDDTGGTQDGEDGDSKLSQAELDKIAGVHGVKDKATLHFIARTQANPQVIRYDTAGAGPLWSSSKGVPEKADVPPCVRCGRARKFEFQVMPHLLHHLGVESTSKVLDSKAGASGKGAASPNAEECMDWGTLAIYSCPDSCPPSIGGAAGAARSCGISQKQEAAKSSSPRYFEEFIWRQPPP